jgi:hypothetical protein
MYLPTTTVLPTADRLARGDLQRYLMGHRMPYKLRSAEWAVYEAAKENGYLVAPSVGLARTRLRNCYFAYCEDLGRPFVCVELRRKWASIELDMIEVPPLPSEREVCRRLSDAAYKRIDALLAEMTTKRRAWWSSGHVFIYSNGIAIEHAPWVAQRLFTIACEDMRGAR